MAFPSKLSQKANEMKQETTKEPLIFALATMLLPIMSVSAQTMPATEGMLFRALTVPLIAKTNSTLASSLDALCFGNTSKIVRSLKLVLAFGIKECRTEYRTTHTIFIEVAEKGKTYLIEDRYTDIKPHERNVLSEIPESDRSRNRDEAIEQSVQLWTGSVDKLRTKLLATKVLGLTILQASIRNESEHTEGTGFEVSVLNPTDKTIKYLTFNVIGYNAVNDAVRDRINGGPIISVKGIGPIDPDESGSYNWKYMWHTDAVQTFKMPSITIQYMDGSTKLLKQVSAATLSKLEYSTLTDED